MHKNLYIFFFFIMNPDSTQIPLCSITLKTFLITVLTVVFIRQQLAQSMID